MRWRAGAERIQTGGIDLVITRDLVSIAVQCKHWKSWQIKVPTVREFLGALTDSGIKRGFIVTLTGYTGEANKLADKHNIEFINETELLKMLNEIGAATNHQVLAILDDTKKYCPKCEAKMTLRISKKGANSGSNFWGCTRYPRCKYTMPFQQKAA